MTNRATRIDLARVYSSSEISSVKATARAALVEAITEPVSERFLTPSGATLWSSSQAVHLWVAAARRVDAATRGPGQPAKSRSHRRTLRTTDDTEAGLLEIAKLEGREVPDLASEIFEEAVKAKGGGHV